MKLCYALRRGVYYPSQSDAFGELPPRNLRPAYLRLLREIGFEGVEIPVFGEGDDAGQAARELRQELSDAGVPPVVVRTGGPVADPRVGPGVVRRLEKAVKFAHNVGASVVDMTIVTPPTHPGGPGEARQGETVSQGSSRLAAEADFGATADRLRVVGRLAADHGLDVSIQVHQGSIADNSWSTLHLLDLIDLANVGANPDLGNIFWQYERAEETMESAIVALAPRAKYWHCKNLVRVFIPELKRSIYLRVPLGDGDIDYRFAIAAMAAAGYQGYLAVEGYREGDQLTADTKSATYALEILRGLR